MRKAFSLIAVLLLAATATGNDGYVLQSDGYYRYGAGVDRYSRAWVVTSAGCYRSGCYYPSVGQWVYTLVPAARPNIVINNNVQPPAYVPYDWRKDAVKFMAQREDLGAYKDWVKAMGYPVPGQPSYGYSQKGTYEGGVVSSVVSGSTSLGYNPYFMAQLFWGDGNSAAIQQTGQLADNANAAAERMYQNQLALVQQDGKQRADIAAIFARASAAQAFLQSLEKPVTTQHSANFKFTPTNELLPAPKPVVPVMPPADPPAPVVKADFQAMVGNKCAACHTGEAGKKNGLDISLWPTFNAEQKARIAARVHPLADEKLRMPRNKDGSAGQLSKSEYEMFLNN
jgi:hypothetical protein